MKRGFLILLAVCLAITCAQALSPGTATLPATAASSAIPLRQALIVAPAPAGGAAAPDAEAYTEQLRLLGFAVTTVVAETRPDLARDLRQFADNVKPGSEVAAFLLGVAPASDKTLYLTAKTPASDAAIRPALLPTEGIALSDLFRRIVARSPKEIIAIVDVCQEAADGADCRQAAASLPDSVSAIVASHARLVSTGEPVARLMSLRSELLPLMRQQDLTFFALFNALKAKVVGTDMTLVSTPSLSRSFAFLPGDYFAKMQNACNLVEATSDASAIHGRPLESLTTACEEAARLYAFSPYFSDKLKIVREQSAFQRVADGCDPTAFSDFLREYPNGYLRSAIDVRQAACETSRREAESRRAPAAEREPTPSVQQAQPAPQPDDTSRLCADFLRKYFEQWSASNAVAYDYISKIYAPSVAYYGTYASRDVVLSEKEKFLARWPDRDYSVVSGRYSLVPGGCTMIGIVRWRATRPTGKTAQGLAEFSLTISTNPFPTIIAENSKVLSRDP